MIFSLCFIIPGIILLYLVIQYSFLVPAPGGVTVLMYHMVSETESGSLCVTTGQLDRHFSHIKDRGYPVISFDTLIDITQKRISPPRKAVLITFDDGYRNNLELACPLLEKYGYPATFFIATAYIGKANEWDQGIEPIMTVPELRELAAIPDMTIGLHSHGHIRYDQPDMDAVEKDLAASMETLAKNGIPHRPVLAYPYGKYPRKNPEKRKAMDCLLNTYGITHALRIGSMVNRLPVEAPYAMTRTNIRGDESFFTFTVKLEKGRAKLFK